MSSNEPQLPKSGPANPPIAYFITFHTYGTWHHFDSRGSVDSQHNAYGTPGLKSDPEWEAIRSERRTGPVVTLDGPMRAIVTKTIREVCVHRGWSIHALHVRTTHVHIVVWGEASPERIMNDFKAWSTRRLIDAGIAQRGAKLWVRHGSTRYLWDEDSVESAKHYVANLQGAPLDGDGEWMV